MGVAQREFIHRHLSNGMEVYLHEQHFSPVCSVNICVKVGSLDESPTQQGMAHVLEHMLFKGSQAFPDPGEIAQRVEAAGGDINAYTTFDRTVYELAAPSDFVRDGSRLLLDMTHNALIDSTEHERETEVIVEEIRRGNDSPGSRLSKKLFHHVFAGTEMGRPIIGTEESVRAFTSESVRAFYQQWYVPNNMILVAAGDFHAAELFEWLEECATQLSPGSVAERVRPQVTPLKSKKSLSTVDLSFGPFQEARAQLASHAPSLEDDTLARWDVFASLLGQGDSSRLAQVVKDEKQLVTGIESSVYSPRYPAGMMAIGCYTRVENLGAALSESIRCVQALARTEPAESEVRRVLTTLKAEKIYARESVEGLVRQNLFQLQTSRGLDFEDHYLSLLQRVTPKAVQETAREFLEKLQSRDRCVCVLANEAAAEQLTSENIEKTLDEALRDTPAIKGQTLSPDGETKLESGSLQKSRLSEESGSHPSVTISSLNSEVKQIVVRSQTGRSLRINYRQTDKIPAVSFGLYAGKVLGASHDVPPGTAALMAQMLTRGTTSLSYRDFVADLENRAASLQSFHGRDLFGIRGDCLAEDFEHTLRLAFDCVFRPAFVPSEFTRVQRESIEVLQSQKDSPFFRLSHLLGPLLYKDHPYARPLHGTEESVAQVSLEHCVQVWQRLVRSEEWIFSLAGDFSEDTLYALLSELFSKGQEEVEAPQESTGIQALTAAARPEGGQVAFGAFEREQAHLLLSFRASSICEEDRTALEVGVNILSGQGGRLFADLREKKSLAYSVSCSQSLALHGGTLAAYIGTSHDKAEEAYLGLKEQLERMAREEPLAAEVARAQQSLLGGQALDSQQLSYQCSQLAYSDAYGLGFDNFLRFRERVEAVTAADVSRAIANRMKDNPPILGIVGPEGTWRPKDTNLTWSQVAADPAAS